MELSTGISRSFRLRLIFIIVLCLVFGLWGIYDLLLSIPNQRQTFERFQSAQQRLSDLEQIRQQRQERGQGMTEGEIAEYQQLDSTIRQLAPDGKKPVPPGKYDALTQWFFILCLPFVPYYALKLSKVRKQVYRLDDDGTIHLPNGEGSWKPEDIADIDMSRWMSKSIAELVHTDGRRVKLDDYVHDKLHLIVGAIAHRLHPDQWDAEARVVKKPEKADSTESTDAEEAGADSEPRES